MPAIIVLLMLALVCAVLLRFVFVVRNVEVGGNLGAVSREEVIRAARIEFGTSVFRVDAERIAEDVNTTGALRAQDVQVRYPDTLSISVAPRSRVAMALHLGQIRVLDENACLVESLDAVPDESLIYVSGLRVQNCAAGRQINADARQISAYCSMMQAIMDNAAAIYVSELNLENPESLRIITRTGITVELGDSQNAMDKIAWMKSAVGDLEQRGQGGGTLDVSSGTKADYRAP